jgi:hypothetical protein
MLTAPREACLDQIEAQAGLQLVDVWIRHGCLLPARKLSRKILLR